MNESREMRAKMAMVNKAENLRKSVATYRKKLLRLWRGPSPLWERKRALFTLWDECAEEGPTPVRVAAAKIRSMTITFVQEQLPSGSGDAFTAQELHLLNTSRRSRSKFRPYAGHSPSE